MRSVLLKILGMIFVGLFIFGFLGFITALTEPEMGVGAAIFFAVWAALSLLAFFKVRKKRKKLQGSGMKKCGVVRGYTPPVQTQTVPSYERNYTDIKKNTFVKPEPTPIQIVQPDQPKNKQTEKIKIRSEELNASEVIQRYLTTGHSNAPAIYDYYGYLRTEFNCILNNIPRYIFNFSSEKVLRNKELLTPFEKSAIITTRTTRKEVENFVAIDTETTGIKVGGNDIIEVSAIKFENFVPVSAFTTLLKPRNPIPAEVTGINGITDEMVQHAPTFAQIKSSLEAFIGNYPIVAHNAGFDVKFLHVSGLNFSEKTVFFDTLELSRKHIRDCYDGSKLENYKLATVCKECSIYFDGAHRSLADALAAGLLFIEIVKAVFDVENIYAIKFSEKPLTSLNELEDWEYYQTQKPLKTFTVTSKEEYADVSMYAVGDEVEQDYDFERDKDTLEINSGTIGNTPKTVQEFFEENYGNYRMFVLDSYEADNGKVKIKIGIFPKK